MTGPGEQTLHGPQHLPGSLAGPSRVRKHGTAAVRLSDRDAFAHRAVSTEHSGRCPETPGQVSGLSRPVPGSLGRPRRAVSGRCAGPGAAALKPPEGGHQERPWEHLLPSLPGCTAEATAWGPLCVPLRVGASGRVLLPPPSFVKFISLVVTASELCTLGPLGSPACRPYLLWAFRAPPLCQAGRHGPEAAERALWGLRALAMLRGERAGGTWWDWGWRSCRGQGMGRAGAD